MRRGEPGEPGEPGELGERGGGRGGTGGRGGRGAAGHVFGRPWAILFVAASLWLLAITAIAVALQVRGDEEWAPLYGYTHVQATDPTEIVWSGGDLPVITTTGTKCFRSALVTVGQPLWRSTSPLGSNVPVGAPTPVRREPGCVTATYRNVIPVDVLEITRRLGGRVTWELSGVEIPSDDRRASGVPASWRTEPITITVQ